MKFELGLDQTDRILDHTCNDFHESDEPYEETLHTVGGVSLADTTDTPFHIDDANQEEPEIRHVVDNSGLFWS